MGGKRVFLAGVCALSLLSGCGSGSGNDEFAQPLPSVDSVEFRDNTAPPGSTTSMRIRFNPGSDITGRDIDGFTDFTSSRFTLVVTLPAGTAYVDESSRITDSVFGDQIFGHPDPRNPSLVGPCGDGRTVVQYNFRQGEFGDPTDLDHGEVFLKFDLTVTSAADGAYVDVTSLIDPPLSACSVDPERSAQLVVR